jgi:hypothetical protein
VATTEGEADGAGGGAHGFVEGAVIQGRSGVGLMMGAMGGGSQG